VISINNLNVSFGGYTLFTDINFHVSPKERVALVGKNGAGKSTLLKIICGIENPSSGTITKRPDLTIGYLPQQMKHSRDKSVLEETLSVYKYLYELKTELDSVTELLSEREDYQSEEYNRLIIRMNELNDRIHFLGSDNPEGSAERTLKGLGFKREEFDRPAATLSEGWNMRIELAKILLMKPELLLLDEPTNHLDIESIQWLEEYLEDYPGSLVLISHDRKFLDNVTNRTVELMLGHAYDYKVPFSKYQELRRERMEQQRAAYENQRRMIEKTEEFIERFRYKPTKSNQVQSRIKLLEKIERIELEPEDNSKLAVRFPPAPRSGEVVLRTKDLKMQYDDKVVFDDVNITIRRGEKVALSGRNGEGKTTFMRLLSGELKQKSGVVELGHNVSLGYYAQNQDKLLNANETVLETLDNIATGDVRTRLRDILGAFLFRGDDVDKKVDVLSGGERSRLAMAKLILKPHNLLALDEPTNHMDIKSKDVLKQALMNYSGTLIIVSHDRDFLEGLVDKIYEFRDGRVREHIGGVMEFLRKLKEEQLVVFQRNVPLKADIAINETPENNDSVFDYKEKKEKERYERKKRNAIIRCEEEIGLLENRIKELENKLSKGEVQSPESSIFVEYENLKKELNNKMNEWEELHT
jgi:ATP-binding cassette subfamily F protein 3